ncbi:VOC family protein [Streptomyces albidoflavus]|uniref:VOC family protein n=1 Tax=Streptomyces TaxID=1883 RepID=UPI00081BB239|nr:MULTISPECIES: VOC family protein [Streptomyces]MYQ74834.1 glyoxalase [Streptomyces sp. SID4934]MYX84623.1 glyoxalase [Streptomyces sp. SID4915]MBV7648485.1 VOC family protein [Streptomyces albidoflavus]MBV7709944.1 VOC family protein [Streptomyces albidoflavus]MCU7702892.1 VOC family protein [Streptomyces albidoflavus]
MNVRRVVPNLRTEDPEACGAFYARIGLSPAMELGWITTLTGTGGGASPVQLSLMTEDLTGPVVPDLSIEVDDVDAAYEELRAAGADMLFPVRDEEWGVRRFFVRDPDGRVVNILGHR